MFLCGVVMRQAEKTILSAAEVVKAARSWIGTPFCHQGRHKAVAERAGACDCLGVLVGVAEELELRSVDGDLLAQFDVRDYGHIPDGARLQHMLDALLRPVRVEDISAGDVLLMRFERLPQHLAIVSDHTQGGLGIIHALAAMRKVVEHRLDAQWHRRIVRAYRVSGVEKKQ